MNRLLETLMVIIFSINLIIYIQKGDFLQGFTYFYFILSDIISIIYRMKESFSADMIALAISQLIIGIGLYLFFPFTENLSRTILGIIYLVLAGHNLRLLYRNYRNTRPD